MVAGFRWPEFFEGARPMQQTPRNGQTQSMPMATPMDLFTHELSDMYSAEQIIADMLEVAIANAADDELKQGLQRHLQESRQHAQNLQQIFQMIDQKPHAVRCYAADGLALSLDEGMQSAQTPQVSDGLIVAGARKAESLEIATYTGLIEKAQLLGQADVTRLLQTNLEQEQRMLQLSEQVGRKLDQQFIGAMAGMMAQQGEMGASAAQT
jgi:ferritin-like metal-binding protein YciE